MALLTKRSFESAILKPTIDKSSPAVHIFEPEFHQPIYLDAETNARRSPYGWYQMHGDLLVEPIHRGVQPTYADNPNDLIPPVFIGQMADGKRLLKTDTTNIAAIKSVGIRAGFVDLDASRSVTREFYLKHKARSGIQKNDLLINSTGDGTICRVAVYHYEYPAVVDGHISIVRFREPELAWYTAAYLLTEDGQKQMYRFINGSSGQVELYPNDLARLIIPQSSPKKRRAITEQMQASTDSFEKFNSLLGSSLASAASFASGVLPD